MNILWISSSTITAKTVIPTLPFFHIILYIGRGSRGQWCLAPPPPPIFWGKNKGAKNHTQKKEIKIGQPRNKIQAKTYPKTHYIRSNFLKKNLARWGGGPKGPQGERGNMLFIKVLKSRKWKNNARNIILFRCSKALYFHTFQKCSFQNVHMKIFIIRLRSAQVCSKSLLKLQSHIHGSGGGSWRISDGCGPPLSAMVRAHPPSSAIESVTLWRICHVFTAD